MLSTQRAARRSRLLARISLPLAAAAVLVVALPASLAAADPGVQPPTVSETASPGGTISVGKTVQTNEAPPVADVYFLADTTGSMSGAIANVQANATTIMNDVLAAAPGSEFGAGEYKDFPFDPFAYRNDASIDSAASAQAGINTWTASGGADGAEAQLYAFHELTTAAGWQPGAAHVLIWFGDFSGHDPICSAISGLSEDITEASATDDLLSQNIRVIAVSVTGGVGLDADPTPFSSDYASICPTVDGSAGQATRITAATDGANFADVSPADVSATIISALAGLDIIVSHTTTCSAPLSVDITPSSISVAPGASTDFEARIHVAADAAPGTYVCTVTFLEDGVPGAGFVERETITVLGASVSPPVSPSSSPPTASPSSLPLTGLGGTPIVAGALGVSLVVAGTALLVVIARKRRSTG